MSRSCSGSYRLHGGNLLKCGGLCTIFWWLTFWLDFIADHCNMLIKSRTSSNISSQCLEKLEITLMEQSPSSWAKNPGNGQVTVTNLPNIEQPYPQHTNATLDGANEDFHFLSVQCLTAHAWCHQHFMSAEVPRQQTWFAAKIYRMWFVFANFSLEPISFKGPDSLNMPNSCVPFVLLERLTDGGLCKSSGTCTGSCGRRTRIQEYEWSDSVPVLVYDWFI